MVIEASPIAAPGTFMKEQTLLVMALAAMATVPKVAVRLCTKSLPMLNVLFSMPLGIPTRRMRLIISGCHSKWKSLLMCIVRRLLQVSTSMIVAPTSLDASVAAAAPAAPHPRMKIK